MATGEQDTLIDNVSGSELSPAGQGKETAAPIPEGIVANLSEDLSEAALAELTESSEEVQQGKEKEKERRKEKQKEETKQETITLEGALQRGMSEFTPLYIADRLGVTTEGFIKHLKDRGIKYKVIKDDKGEIVRIVIERQRDATVEEKTTDSAELAKKITSEPRQIDIALERLRAGGMELDLSETPLEGQEKVLVHMLANLTLRGKLDIDSDILEEATDEQLAKIEAQLKVLAEKLEIDVEGLKVTREDSGDTNNPYYISISKTDNQPAGLPQELDSLGQTDIFTTPENENLFVVSMLVNSIALPGGQSLTKMAKTAFENGIPDADALKTMLENKYGIEFQGEILVEEYGTDITVLFPHAVTTESYAYHKELTNTDRAKIENRFTEEGLAPIPDTIPTPINVAGKSGEEIEAELRAQYEQTGQTGGFFIIEEADEAAAEYLYQKASDAFDQGRDRGIEESTEEVGIIMFPFEGETVDQKKQVWVMYARKDRHPYFRSANGDAYETALSDYSKELIGERTDDGRSSALIDVLRDLPDTPGQIHPKTRLRQLGFIIEGHYSPMRKAQALLETQRYIDDLKRQYPDIDFPDLPEFNNTIVDFLRDSENWPPEGEDETAEELSLEERRTVAESVFVDDEGILLLTPREQQGLYGIGIDILARAQRDPLTTKFGPISFEQGTLAFGAFDESTNRAALVESLEISLRNLNLDVARVTFDKRNHSTVLLNAPVGEPLQNELLERLGAIRDISLTDRADLRLIFEQVPQTITLNVLSDIESPPESGEWRVNVGPYATAGPNIEYALEELGFRNVQVTREGNSFVITYDHKPDRIFLITPEGEATTEGNVLEAASASSEEGSAGSGEQAPQPGRRRELQIEVPDIKIYTSQELTEWKQRLDRERDQKNRSPVAQTANLFKTVVQRDASQNRFRSTTTNDRLDVAVVNFYNNYVAIRGEDDVDNFYREYGRADEELRKKIRDAMVLPMNEDGTDPIMKAKEDYDKYVENYRDSYERYEEAKGLTGTPAEKEQIIIERVQDFVPLYLREVAGETDLAGMTEEDRIKYASEIVGELLRVREVRLGQSISVDRLREAVYNELGIEDPIRVKQQEEVVKRGYENALKVLEERKMDLSDPTAATIIEEYVRAEAIEAKIDSEIADRILERLQNKEKEDIVGTLITAANKIREENLELNDIEFVQGLIRSSLKKDPRLAWLSNAERQLDDIIDAVTRGRATYIDTFFANEITESGGQAHMGIHEAIKKLEKQGFKIEEIKKHIRISDNAMYKGEIFDEYAGRKVDEERQMPLRDQAVFESWNELTESEIKDIQKEIEKALEGNTGKWYERWANVINLRWKQLRSPRWGKFAGAAAVAALLLALPGGAAFAGWNFLLIPGAAGATFAYNMAQRYGFAKDIVSKRETAITDLKEKFKRFHEVADDLTVGGYTMSHGNWINMIKEDSSAWARGENLDESVGVPVTLRRAMLENGLKIERGSGQQGLAQLKKVLLPHLTDYKGKVGTVLKTTQRYLQTNVANQDTVNVDSLFTPRVLRGGQANPFQAAIAA